MQEKHRDFRPETIRAEFKMPGKRVSKPISRGWRILKPIKFLRNIPSCSCGMIRMEIEWEGE